MRNPWPADTARIPVPNGPHRPTSLASSFVVAPAQGCVQCLGAHGTDAIGSAPAISTGWSTSSPPSERQILRYNRSSCSSNWSHCRSNTNTGLGNDRRSWGPGPRPQCQNLRAAPITGSSSCSTTSSGHDRLSMACMALTVCPDDLQPQHGSAVQELTFPTDYSPQRAVTQKATAITHPHSGKTYLTGPEPQKAASSATHRCSAAPNFAVAR